MSVAACNVLLASAGRRVALLRAFQNDLRAMQVAGTVSAADASPRTAAGHLAASLDRLPRVDDPTFADALIEVCDRRSIRLLVPTIDPELPVLAALAAG
jgi:carbamoyl-phosphate synthase large subunit